MWLPDAKPPSVACARFALPRAMPVARHQSAKRLRNFGLISPLRMSASCPCLRSVFHLGYPRFLRQAGDLSVEHRSPHARIPINLAHTIPRSKRRRCFEQQSNQVSSAICSKVSRSQSSWPRRRPPTTSFNEQLHEGKTMGASSVLPDRTITLFCDLSWMAAFAAMTRRDRIHGGSSASKQSTRPLAACPWG